MEIANRFKVVADNGGERANVVLGDATAKILEQVVHEVQNGLLILDGSLLLTGRRDAQRSLYFFQLCHKFG